MRNVIVLAAALFVAGVGCGGDDDGPAVTTITCNFDASDFCSTVTGPELARAGYTQATCEADGGAVVSACSPTNRIGRCTETQGAIQMVTHLYPPTWDASFETACTGGGGTWQPN